MRRATAANRNRRAQRFALASDGAPSMPEVYMPYGLTEAIVEDYGARLILAMDPLTIMKRDAVSGIFAGVDEPIAEGELVYSIQDLSLANFELLEGAASEGPAWNESGVADRSLDFTADRLKIFASTNSFRFMQDNTVDFSMQLGLAFNAFPTDGNAHYITATRGFGPTPGHFLITRNTGGVITLEYGVHQGGTPTRIVLNITTLDLDTLYWVRLTHAQDPTTPVTTLSVLGTGLSEVDTLTSWNASAQDDNFTIGSDADGTGSKDGNFELVGLNVNKGLAASADQFDEYKTYFEGRIAA